MKILHLCLSCFYIDGYNYQENVLPIMNKLDGHDVKIIASTETFINNKELGYIEAKEYITDDGIQVQRIPYKKYLPHFIMKKIRHYENVYSLIEDFSPDVILFHGVPAYELLTVAKYKRNNPHVKLYLDSHEDYHNSATNFISKNILHKAFYKKIIHKSLPYVDKILYITKETKDFLVNIYSLPEDIMEIYPLGGVIPDEIERLNKRAEIRKSLNLLDDDILIIHSGKMDKLKRTKEILDAFKEVNNDKLKLILIGSLADEVRDEVENAVLIDERIRFLGWKKAEELLDFLCACDMYMQPGSQSATLQNAICCGCVVATYPHDSYKHLLPESSVFFIETSYDIAKLLSKILDDASILENKRIESVKVAHQVLDYRVLASRLYK